jgi:hypothetical protein
MTARPTPKVPMTNLVLIGMLLLALMFSTTVPSPAYRRDVP